MTLATRLSKLEMLLRPKIEQVHFLGWKGCEWNKAEGLTRYEWESRENFFKRVRKNTDKKWIWVD